MISLAEKKKHFPFKTPNTRRVLCSIFNNIGMTVTVYLLCPLRNVVRLDLFILRSPFHRLRSKPTGVNVFCLCVRAGLLLLANRFEMCVPCAVPWLHTFNHRYLCRWCEWMRCGQHSNRHLSLSVTHLRCACIWIHIGPSDILLALLVLFLFFCCVCFNFKIRYFCLCCHLFMGHMNAVSH